MRLLAAVLAAATVSVAAAQQRPDAFSVGVMRRDGALVPFAAFDGKRWSYIWPPPQLDLQIPINLASVPKSWWGSPGPFAEWQLWPLSPTSGAPRTVKVTQPDWVPTHCVRQIALRTDYRSDRPIPSLAEQPYPKDGLVVAPPQTVARVARVALDSKEAGSLDGVVTEAFNRGERETSSRFNHPVKRETRERAPVTIEAIYALGENPRVYYVESARIYKSDSGNERDCAMAFGTGWFVRDAAGAARKLDMAVDILPCNRYGAAYMLPLGVIQIAGRTFWIVQYSGWDHERYVVAEIKKDRVDAAVIKGGGGC